MFFSDSHEDIRCVFWVLLVCVCDGISWNWALCGQWGVTSDRRRVDLQILTKCYVTFSEGQTSQNPGALLKTENSPSTHSCLSPETQQTYGCFDWREELCYYSLALSLSLRVPACYAFSTRVAITTTYIVSFPKRTQYVYFFNTFNKTLRTKHKLKQQLGVTGNWACGIFIDWCYRRSSMLEILLWTLWKYWFYFVNILLQPLSI